VTGNSLSSAAQPISNAITKTFTLPTRIHSIVIIQSVPAIKTRSHGRITAEITLGTTTRKISGLLRARSHRGRKISTSGRKHRRSGWPSAISAPKFGAVLSASPETLYIKDGTVCHAKTPARKNASEFVKNLPLEGKPQRIRVKLLFWMPISTQVHIVAPAMIPRISIMEVELMSLAPSVSPPQCSIPMRILIQTSMESGFEVGYQYGWLDCLRSRSWVADRNDGVIRVWVSFDGVSYFLQCLKVPKVPLSFFLVGGIQARGPANMEGRRGQEHLLPSLYL
jgi:hypothetical protein